MPGASRSTPGFLAYVASMLWDCMGSCSWEIWETASERNLSDKHASQAMYNPEP